MLGSGTVALLSSWPWQAFVTLSWRDRRDRAGFYGPPGPIIRERMFFSWIRRVGVRSGVGHHRGVGFLWARREEKGEATGREHFHVLLGGLPGWFVRDFVLRPKSAVGSWWWAFQGGNVRSSCVNSVGEVAEYLTKETPGAREYELGKFGSSQVMLSNDAVNKLKSFARAAATSRLDKLPEDTGMAVGRVEIGFDQERPRVITIKGFNDGFVGRPAPA